MAKMSSLFPSPERARERLSVKIIQNSSVLLLKVRIVVGQTFGSCAPPFGDDWCMVNELRLW